MIYTTTAVEALHRSLRKIIKTRGSSPNDDAALKQLYLAIKKLALATPGRTDHPRWASLPSGSPSVFRERCDDERHHDNGHDGSARPFAVKSRAWGAPLRGFGLDRSVRPSKLVHHAADSSFLMPGHQIHPSQKPLTQNF
ncbi:hypothetical protein [Bradyrhizobium brasilense]|uniref:hypothetical protein n=1 Tax=Bradyrhizobium brasilense TaxID=1419277 RepID=UPI003D31BCB0|nr:hypothetical protein [Bradyrhizobium brasilense]